MADPNHTQLSLAVETSQLQPKSQSAVSALHFEALKEAMGDNGELLSELPFHRVELLPHTDESLVARKNVPLWKIRMGSTKYLDEPIYAYLMGIHQGNLAVSFFSFSNDDEEHGVMHDISTIIQEDLREEYAGALTQDSLKALVKVYFIHSGVCDTIPVVFSKSLLNDIDRVCKSFAKLNSKSVGKERRAVRRTSVFVDAVSAQSSIPRLSNSFQLPSRPATPLASVAPVMHASQPVVQQPAHPTVSPTAPQSTILY